MAKIAKVKTALKDAAAVRTVWEANPDFRMGSIGLSDFIALHDATQELDKNYAKKDIELAGIRNKRDDNARELFDLVSRFRSGMRAHYGSDSAEYAQAGCTRLSDRKAPSRNGKAVPESTSAVSHTV